MRCDFSRSFFPLELRISYRVVLSSLCFHYSSCQAKRTRHKTNKDNVWRYCCSNQQPPPPNFLGNVIINPLHCFITKRRQHHLYQMSITIVIDIIISQSSLAQVSCMTREIECSSTTEANVLSLGNEIINNITILGTDRKQVATVTTYFTPSPTPRRKIQLKYPIMLQPPSI